MAEQDTSSGSPDSGQGTADSSASGQSQPSGNINQTGNQDPPANCMLNQAGTWLKATIAEWLFSLSATFVRWFIITGPVEDSARAFAEAWLSWLGNPRRDHWPRPQSADLFAAIVGRLLRISFLRYFILSLPALAILLQVYIMMAQNELLAQQTRLATAQALHAEASELQASLYRVQELKRVFDDSAGSLMHKWHRLVSFLSRKDFAPAYASQDRNKPAEVVTSAVQEYGDNLDAPEFAEAKVTTGLVGSFGVTKNATSSQVVFETELRSGRAAYAAYLALPAVGDVRELRRSYLELLDIAGRLGLELAKTDPNIAQAVPLSVSYEYSDPNQPNRLVPILTVQTDFLKANPETTGLPWETAVVKQLVSELNRHTNTMRPVFDFQFDDMAQAVQSRIAALNTRRQALLTSE